MRHIPGILLTVLLVLFLGLATTLLFSGLGLDLALSTYFFSVEGAGGGWSLGTEQPWKSLYRYGEIPGILLSAGVMLVLIGTYLGLASATWRKPCLVVLITVLIGPGILVNGLLKTSWGRPRPVDVVEFGGAQQYRDVWPPSPRHSGKSFTCGHCAMGFSLSSAAVFFVSSPIGSWFVMALGLAYGFLLGVARVAQGGHFATDVVWSFVVVYAVMALVYAVVFQTMEIPRQFSSQKQRR